MGEERSVAAARYASSDIQARWFAPRERARWGGGGDGPMVDGLSPIAPFEGVLSKNEIVGLTAGHVSRC